MQSPTLSELLHEFNTWKVKQLEGCFKEIPKELTTPVLFTHWSAEVYAKPFPPGAFTKLRQLTGKGGEQTAKKLLKNPIFKGWFKGINEAFTEWVQNERFQFHLDAYEARGYNFDEILKLWEEFLKTLDEDEATWFSVGVFETWNVQGSTSFVPGKW